MSEFEDFYEVVIANLSIHPETRYKTNDELKEFIYEFFIKNYSTKETVQIVDITYTIYKQKLING